MSKSTFDRELKDRAVRMYHQELETEGQTKIGARRAVGAKLGVNLGTLHNWIRKQESELAAAQVVS